MSELDRQAREVLRHYPRIYIACHTDHRARRGQGAAITARDQTIRAHIPDGGLRPQHLAGHLDMAASTLSAALKRLVSMDLLAFDPDPNDARSKIARLTEKGRAALATTSVLDIARVRAALKRLGAGERAAVVRSLSLLADAAQAVRGGKR